jgi:hypothetical protein
MNSKIIAAQNDRVESLQYSNVLIAFLFIMERQCCPRIESRWRAPHLLLLLELPVQSNKGKRSLKDVLEDVGTKWQAIGRA